MTPNQALQLYTALKLHFTTASYDFQKYGGKLKNPVDYKKRNDKFQIEKLARHSDPMNLVISNLLKNVDAWVGDIVSIEGLKNYQEWQKRSESLTYEFKQDIKHLDPSLDRNLETSSAEHPILFKLYLGHRISLDTFCIMESILRFAKRWDCELKEDIIWKDTSNLIKKYMPFMSFDKQKFAAILLDHFR